MSKTDWGLMNLIDKELYDALGIDKTDWKFRMSPCGLINVGRREKKSDIFYYLEQAVSHTILVKFMSESSTPEENKKGALAIHAYSEFINNNENLKKFLES